MNDCARCGELAAKLAELWAVHRALRGDAIGIAFNLTETESREAALREALVATARRPAAIDRQGPCWCPEDPGQWPPDEGFGHVDGCRAARAALATKAAP